MDYRGCASASRAEYCDFRSRLREVPYAESDCVFGGTLWGPHLHRATADLSLDRRGSHRRNESEFYFFRRSLRTACQFKRSASALTSARSKNAVRFTFSCGRISRKSPRIRRITLVARFHFFRHSAGITIRPRSSIFFQDCAHGIYPTICPTFRITVKWSTGVISIGSRSAALPGAPTIGSNFRLIPHPPILKYATPLRAPRMAEKKSRAAPRKIKDKWKAKVWYNLLAPEMFNRQVLGETPTDTPDKLVGRVTEVTVQDLTGDFSKMHIKLQFRVNQVQGQDALTQFVGHDMTSDYIRRLTRRKRTRTDLTVDVVTKDHWNVRVKPMAITDRRIQTSKQRIIRTIMAKLVADVAAKQSIGEFVKGVISGDLAKTIAQGCKPIHPVSRVEVRKSEVWAMGEVPPPAEPPAAEAPSPAPPAPEEPAPAPSPAPAPEELTPEELPPDEI